MRVLILGATGLFVKELMSEWSRDEVVGLGSRVEDIRAADRVYEVVAKASPGWIVLSAAYTNVDECESLPDLAFEVNREGAVYVAKAAKQTGAKLLFLSSDY